MGFLVKNAIEIGILLVASGIFIFLAKENIDNTFRLLKEFVLGLIHEFTDFLKIPAHQRVDAVFIMMVFVLLLSEYILGERKCYTIENERFILATFGVLLVVFLLVGISSPLISMYVHRQEKQIKSLYK